MVEKEKQFLTRLNNELNQDPKFPHHITSVYEFNGKTATSQLISFSIYANNMRYTVYELSDFQIIFNQYKKVYKIYSDYLLNSKGLACSMKNEFVQFIYNNFTEEERLFFKLKNNL